MAQKAKKDRAKANITTLNNLHIGTASLNALFLVFNLLVKRRSLFAWFLFSIPCLVAQFILETSGRPKFDSTTKALKSAGEDLSAPGLTEYLMDIIWVTWCCLIAVITFGNWGWVVFGVIPVYGAYKGYGLLGMARGMMGSAKSGHIPDDVSVQAQGNRKQRRAA